MMVLYVLGIDGAVHDGWMRMDRTVYADCTDAKALRPIGDQELPYFKRWCPLCFPDRELDAEFREVMQRRCA